MKNEKDLFNEIGNVLHAHEDAYVPGAWEEFVKNKKRRRGLIYIRLLAAACILLFLGYAAWLFKPSTPVDTENNQTKNTEKPPYIYPKTNPRHDSLATYQPVVPKKTDNGTATLPLPLAATQQPAVGEKALTGKTFAETLPPVNQPDKIKKPVVTNNIAQAVKAKPDSTAVVTTVPPSKNTVDPSLAPNNAPSVTKTTPKRIDRGTQRLSYDSLANLNKPKPLPEKKKNNNLSYAVMVSPSVGNQKMNFGTGVEVAYNFNQNFSVSSGIAYAYVNAGSNRSPSLDANRNLSFANYSSATLTPQKDAAAYSPANSSQTVQSVKLALSGVEIPLNFQYKTKGGFFVSAGVSAMSVIGNNLSYNLLDSRTTSVAAGNGLGSSIIVTTREVTAKSNEKVAGYVGFYTLSAGKKLNFGRGKLNFAPFIKIPFNGVSSENIQLMHGGVQLGFGF